MLWAAGVRASAVRCCGRQLRRYCQPASAGIDIRHTALHAATDHTPSPSANNLIKCLKKSQTVDEFKTFLTDDNLGALNARRLVACLNSLGSLLALSPLNRQQFNGDLRLAEGPLITLLEQVVQLAEAAGPNDATDVCLLYRQIIDLQLPPTHPCSTAMANYMNENLHEVEPTILLQFIAYYAQVDAHYRNRDLHRNLLAYMADNLSALLEDGKSSTRAEKLLTVLSIERVHTIVPVSELSVTVMHTLPDMESSQIVRLLSLMARNGLRLKPVLNDASRRLFEQCSEQPASMSVPACLQLYSVMHRLRFVSAELLWALKASVLTHLPAINNSWSLLSLLNAFAQLRYRHEELLLPVLDRLQTCLKPKRLSPRPMCTLLANMARLNYCPPGRLLDQIKQCIQHDVSLREDTSLWLNVVFALTVLGHLDMPFAESVVNKEFVARALPENGASIPFAQRIAHCKLLNIASAAAALPGADDRLPLDAVPFMPDEHKVGMPEVRYAGCDTQVAESLRTLLSQLAVDADECIHAPYVTEHAIVIDACVMLDADNRLLPLAAWAEAGRTRTAIMCWQYNHCTVDAHEHNVYPPTHLQGAHALSMQILAEHGYNVVSIFAHELNALADDEERLQLLASKLNVQYDG